MIYKKTKIICTIGPAVDTVEKICELIDAGMDAARLNFSHGTHEIHKLYIENIKEAARLKGKIIAIIQDLPGPKIRVGRLEKGSIELVAGWDIIITSEEIIGNDYVISTNYHGLINDLNIGEAILLDDGNLKLKVSSIDRKKGEAVCEIINGGILKEKKGVNLPHTKLNMNPLTEKDLDHLEFGLKHEVDFIAMSFVRVADDITHLRNIMKTGNFVKPIIAKIERPEAVQNIESIIKVSDVIMVARGDMGVEISTEEVPLIQKMIIGKCNELIKPVITATQMLESMIHSPTPTRAEASDIANAIFDGTDCVMLSAETSTGDYPIETVRIMKKIITKTETEKQTKYFNEIFIEDSPENTLHTICNSATEIATRVDAKAIITISHTGKSPMLLSNHRPNAQIISATHDVDIIRKCKLIWGVESIKIDKSPDYNETVKMIRECIIENNILSKDDRVVLIAPMPFSESESANMIQVTQV